MRANQFLLGAICSHLLGATAVFLPFREHAGATFFDGWDYYGDVDNTTWGNVTFLDQPNAVQQRLTFTNDAGNAIVKVDNTTLILDAPVINRNSIRLTSKDIYGMGSLWIIDAVHLPVGCSVWPSFWTLGIGPEWPAGGEIDIIEAINLMGNNQMALHTNPGCVRATNSNQTGTDNFNECPTKRGCTVAETKPNSYGAPFNAAGGGVFATQMDETGVFIWFWSRPDIPESIKSATSTSTMDTSTFGIPSASYLSTTCKMTDFFTPQQLVLLITLCGEWAGVPSIYSSTCGTQNTCVSNILGTGSPIYDEAYFEIPYIRTYYAEGTTPLPPPGNNNISPSPSLSSLAETPSESAQETGGPGVGATKPSSATALMGGGWVLGMVMSGLTMLTRLVL